MIDVARLRVFRAVVAAGSIQAAAAHLGYTPSAVSQQVAALARETGLTLLQRVGRGIEPTAAGLRLAQASGPLFERLADVESAAEDLRTGRVGTLSMAYFTSAAMAWIPGIVADVLAHHPDLRLDLRVQELPTGEDDRVDIEVLVSDADLTPPPGYRGVPLLTEPYVAVLPRDHRLAGRDSIEMAELAGERWIAHDAPEAWCRRITERACVAAGFVPAYSVFTNGHPTAIAFVAQGIGVAAMPLLCVRDLTPDAVAVPLLNPTPERIVHVMVRRAVEDTAPVRRALAGLVAAAVDHPGRDDAPLRDRNGAPHASRLT